MYKMKRMYDLTGQVFGRWTVIEKAENDKHNKSQWLCKCSCGNEKIVSNNSLLRGQSKSCGCLQKERASDSAKNNFSTHKESKTRLYKIWQKMKHRCYNPNSKDYNNYGGRGITICDEWKNNYEPFRDWALENGYTENLTIDRINVDGIYSPSNCRWATKLTQANNRRSNIVIEYNGRTQTLKQWCEELQLPYVTIKYRIKNNWTVERAFTQKIR